MFAQRVMMSFCFGIQGQKVAGAMSPSLICGGPILPVKAPQREKELMMIMMILPVRNKRTDGWA